MNPSMSFTTRQPTRAIIFDLDGTLLDTLADLGNSVNRVLAGRGLPVHALDAYRYMVGEGATVLIKRALPDDLGNNPEVFMACFTAFLKDYSKNWAIATRPYDGVAEMLTGLAGQGIKLAVLSNKPDDFTRLCVSRFLAAWNFEVVLGQVADLPRKPDPAGALAIAGRLNLPPQAFLYLGDTAIDMQTAIAAGMPAVGAAWGFRTREELLAHGARQVIDRPPDLLTLLQEKSATAHAQDPSHR